MACMYNKKAPASTACYSTLAIHHVLEGLVPFSAISPSRRWIRHNEIRNIRPVWQRRLAHQPRGVDFNTYASCRNNCSGRRRHMYQHRAKYACKRYSSVRPIGSVEQRSQAGTGPPQHVGDGKRQPRSKLNDATEDAPRTNCRPNRGALDSHRTGSDTDVQAGRWRACRRARRPSASSRHGPLHASPSKCSPSQPDGSVFDFCVVPF